ncbi:BspA family leucine-rich repeat surface protein [Rhodohalobacter sp. 614A]|uniref:BspA family leucine-rich repeat surface protein n=1 Tax=Rhodohalobacter sp. 614A TaxID=2908649 RepID=UPI001F1975FD|nr:BspA family leucine-rich repeat surface protein [Rhodohalobacter sp. 614A]
MKQFRVFILIVVAVILSASGVQAQSSITPGDPGNFITIWNTENSGFTANDEITIPHANGESYNFTVYWEDTTNSSVNGTETFTSPFFTIQFPDPGIYRVEISGEFPRIFFAGTGDRRKILSVEQWGDIEWTSMENAFRGAQYLEINATDAPDLSNVTSMARMFESARAINSDLNNWNVSNVEDMSSLFNGAISFNGDISDWTVYAVSNMSEMFSNADAFNQDIGGWDVSGVTGNGMIEMFQNASSFNQDISEWDVSGVESMSRMFNGASVFNQDIGYDSGTGEGWDVSNVWNMGGMFQNADKFNGDISGWKVSSVTDMGGMFNSVDDFNQDLNDWDVSEVTTMASMFQNTQSFNGNITGWIPEKVENMNSMFSGATAFNQDISGWDTGNVSSMYRMFYEASSFDQNLGSWNVESVESPNTMTYMFDNTALSRPNYDGILTGWATQDVNSGITLGADGVEYCAESARTTLIDKGWTINGDALAASCPVITDPFTTVWNTSNPGDSNSNQIRIPLFGNGYDFTIDWGDGLDESYTLNPGTNTSHFIEHTYSTAGTYTVEIRGDFPRIYFNNSGDKEKILSVEAWGEIMWDEMEFAFYGASNLEINAPDSPDLTNVVSLYSMFQDASSINSSFNQWDVSGVENMANMFWGASSFNQILDDWETGNVEKMESMFRGASNFNRDIGMWDISNVILMEFMLDNSGISVENYDNILSGWAGQTVQGNVELGADGLQYCYSEADRQILIDAPNSWTINGDSIATGCSISGMDPFITIWDTDDTSIEIPTSGSGYNYAVYWEKEDDSNVNGTLLENTGDVTISVPESGIYRVEIYEDFPRIHFANFDYPDSEKEELMSIEQWGDIEWSSMVFAFYGAVNLEINATDAPDLTNVTSLEGMFGEAVKLNSDLNHWDVSNIETMRRMFQGKLDETSAFNGDISNWDVDNVTNMQQMFQHATSFNQDIGGWNVSGVENMRQMFARAESFNQYIGYNSGSGEGWDMSSVTDLSGMFMNATSFNQDIGDWDVSNVTNMGEFDGVSGGTFENATSFNQDLSGWDITGVTGSFGNDMINLFDNSGLSRENYDLLLEAWSVLVEGNGGPENLTLGAAGLTYCAEAARNNLINNHGWSIDGDALAGDCVSPQVVSASNSEVTATTPHTADGVDESTITIVLRDEEDDPITGFTDGNFSVELTGSASASAVTESGTAGTYTFTVTDTAEEIVTVTVTADGTELDDEPIIDFEALPQVVDASDSEVTATSPHTADGSDQSTVTIVLRDEEDDPISGYSSGDFSIDLSGSATAAEITETGTPGTYSFTVTNTVEEVVTISITANGTELDDKPAINFNSAPQIVDAENSVVTVTSPHSADGVDESTVTVVLRDEDDDPVIGYSSPDFLVEITGSADASTISETSTAGTYSFTVTNSVEEMVEVSITANGIELNDKPTINFETPVQVVSASNSEVTATTPHIADGIDISTVTIVLKDEADDPISGYSLPDFLIDLSGSAVASEIAETDTPGTYSFTVTDTSDELVTVEITAGGVELTDKPEIDFQTPVQIVDGEKSSMTASSPHIANSADASTIRINLVDIEGEPVAGLTNADFQISLKGDATPSEVTESEKPGIYFFNLTSSEPGTVVLGVTAKGITLSDQESVVFEVPEVVADPSLSDVSFTSPHLADGVDASTVTIILRDAEKELISGFTSNDFKIEIKGTAEISDVSETKKPGVYTFFVVSNTAGIVGLSISAQGVLLDDQVKILFEAPGQFVDAFNSEVTATTPHLADGEDASVIFIILRDTENQMIIGLDLSEFSIKISGNGIVSPLKETEPGLYQGEVTNNTAETVSVVVTVSGVTLQDQPKITFEKAPDPIPDPPVITGLDGDENSVQLAWQSGGGDYITGFLIYRGAASASLNQIAQVAGGTFQYTDTNPGGTTSFYAVSAVNSEGIEGDLSDVVSFYNSAIVADNSQWKLVSNPIGTAIPNHENATLFSFNNHYQQSSELEPTRGYWIKSKTFDAEVLPITGSGLTSSTIQLQEGWNLIGSLSAPVSVNNIIDESEILTSTPVFGFSGSGYEQAEILNPNEGYWIYAESDGVIELEMIPSSNAFQEKVVVAQHQKTDRSPNKWIEFSRLHQKRKLWIEEESVNHEKEMQYMLPPIAPGGALDIRTSRNLNLVNNDNELIAIQSDEYPISVSIYGLEPAPEFTWRFILFDDGVERSVDLLPGKSIQIEKKYDRVELAKISMDEVITDHKLLPNYPNPFNPSTTIQYQLHEQVHVNIEVFDVAGRRVQILANELQASGNYRVQFDARQFSSGMYFVRFIAGDVPQIQKITLIK